MRNVSTADERIRMLMASRSPVERLRMCARMFAGAKALVLAGMAGGAPAR